MNTNLISRTLAPAAGVGVGVGLASNAGDDWLKILGIILTAVSAIVPILQAMRARKNDPARKD